MCAGINGDAVIFWANQKLHYISMLTPVDDAPYFYIDQFVFPDDEGGEKGKIFGEQIEGKYAEDEDKEIINRYRKVEYQWLNSKLKKIKVLIYKK